ncbi:hypothetical protein PPACK8108_LOCUS6032 [Phakopsora pachyrhizi]|uniref:Aspartyl/Glutamyl-tRNA(Gln) amidotransferase subunit B/E catalytic domain-containing protein n=1 Tax=Phakopsora pachyrhizi TaxID=170000 RepID=A0AAV0AS31_PHAPC|nr:hypothetical protein PPACK8108_LOCUS6032 [Phakopsora pachyrhizi]
MSSQQLRGEPSAVESEGWKLQPDQQYHQNLSHFNTSVSKFYASIPESQPILSLDCLRNGRILIGKDDGVDREFEPDLDKVTLIDLNRSGVGLIEIVAEPDLKMAKEASSFVRKLQTLLRFLGISKVNIEQGEIYIPERPDSMIKRIWKDNGLRLVVVLLQMLEYSEGEEPKEPEDMDKGDFNISNDSLPRGLGRWRDRSMSRRSQLLQVYRQKFKGIELKSRLWWRKFGGVYRPTHEGMGMAKSGWR